ncbi:hypothetical protein BDQ17DRAFT_1326747 [Cyathus striatus]|nr:hypothetical protein BDQ17DRAFT_1326747 [Cyathus striatus]
MCLVKKSTGHSLSSHHMRKQTSTEGKIMIYIVQTEPSRLSRLEISQFLDISLSAVYQALRNLRSDDLTEDPMFIDDNFRRKFQRLRMGKSHSDEDSYVPSSNDESSGCYSNDEIDDSVSKHYALNKVSQSRGNHKYGKRFTEKVRPEAHRKNLIVKVDHCH